MEEQGSPKKLRPEPESVPTPGQALEHLTPGQAMEHLTPGQALEQFIEAKAGGNPDAYLRALYDLAVVNLQHLKTIPIPEESVRLQHQLNLILSGKIKLNFTGQKNIVIFVDPGADWDDESMLFYLLQAIFDDDACIKVIISSGSMTSQARLIALAKYVPFFEGMIWGQSKYLSGNSGPVITIYEDGYLFPYDSIIDSVLVCASIAKQTWESLELIIKPGCLMIGVGFGPNGIDDGGINTKFTQEGGLYRDKVFWDAMMTRMIVKGVRIFSLSAQISRYVIIKNINILPPVFQGLINKTHRMFAVSRPPANLPSALVVRLNEANGVLASSHMETIPDFDCEIIQAALKVMATYDAAGVSPEAISQAALPIVYAHILGAVYKEGMTGFSPTAENKETCPCLTPESSVIVSANIKTGTTPYDLLGAIMMSEIVSKSRL